MQRERSEKFAAGFWMVLGWTWRALATFSRCERLERWRILVKNSFSFASPHFRFTHCLEALLIEVSRCIFQREVSPWPLQLLAVYFCGCLEGGFHLGDKREMWLLDRESYTANMELLLFGSGSKLNEYVRLGQPTPGHLTLAEILLGGRTPWNWAFTPQSPFLTSHELDHLCSLDPCPSLQCSPADRLQRVGKGKRRYWLAHLHAFPP